MNPTVRKGDLVILKESRNHKGWEGLLLEIVSGGQNPLARDINGVRQGNINLYNSHPADVYILADRTAQAKFVQVEIKKTKARLKSLQKDLDILVNFDSEEDYIAHKIDKLMKAKGVKAIAEILRELKRTNFI